MHLRDCFIGKIVKTCDGGIPVHITGLGLNPSGDVILEIEYPKLDSLHEGTVEYMKRDSDCRWIYSRYSE